MNKTYTTIKYNKRNPISLDALKKSLEHFEVSQTGFVIPDCEVIIECDENKHIFASSIGKFETTEDAEQEESFNSVTLVITHNDSFTDIISDEFIKDFHNTISLHPSEKVVKGGYEIDTIMSACL